MSETSRTARVGLARVPIFQTGVALTILVTSVVVALFLTLVLYQVVFLDRIYLGVYAMGVDVGGMTNAEAKTAIAGRVEEYLSFPVVLQYDEREWAFTARELGATIDVGQTAGQAYSIGRQSGFWNNLRQQWRAIRHNVHVGASVRYDSGPANVALTEIALSVDRPARDAQLIISPDATVDVLESRIGLAVDVEATRELLHKSALSRSSEPVSLVVRQTPPSVTEVDQAAEIARSLLSAPLVLSAHVEDEAIEVQIDTTQLKDMLKVYEEIGPDGLGHITLAIQEETWAAILDQITAQVDRAPVNARFEVDADSGTINVLLPSQTGYALDRPAALALLSDLIRQPAHHIDLPVVQIQPAVSVDMLPSMGLTDVVAEATTFFQGSEEARVHNIQTAAARFHGLVVPPGEVFSFNDILGPVTAENGFEDSLIIWGDRTAVGIGGGVCQVSTTAFRAAFFGGFEIVERWAHGYRVGWYETESGPGLDATIYAPDIDFKFRNDTNSYLLIQTDTNTQDGTLTFRFYGTPVNRVVTMEGPLEENVRSPDPPVYRDDPTLPEGTVKQVDWEKEGVDVTVHRTVTENGEVIHQDTFVSRYQPWQAVFLVGTGEESGE